MNEYELMVLRQEDLISNPTARVPVCLCLDISSSMNGLAIDELNKGVEMFYEAIRNDETALFAAEISIVTFGGNYEAKCLQDFSNIQRQETPVLSANGMTPLGEGVELALELLERRKQEYRDKGVDYYQPWLVLMTDGAPNGNQETLNYAISDTVDLVKSKKLTVFPIGIGQYADMDVLSKFSPDRSPLRLQGLKFKEFFAWLSNSISRTSMSTPGEEVKLDIDGVKGWGSL